MTTPPALNRDDPGTPSYVTRVDASTPVNDHDQNVDTLLTPAKRVRGPRSGSYPRPAPARDSKRARRPIPRLTQPHSFRDLGPASGPQAGVIANDAGVIEASTCLDARECWTPPICAETGPQYRGLTRKLAE